MKKIADSGLIIAALDGGDAFHEWAADLIRRESPPWLVCEAVLAEISASVGTPEPVLEMLKLGDLQLAFDLNEEKLAVLALTKKYRDQQMDLADACVVRMSELLADSVVFTVDRKDFSVYRRNGNRAVKCVFPE